MFKTILLAIAMTFLSMGVLADNFEANQFNLKAKTKDIGIEVRTYTNSSRDHIQLEKYIGKWTFAYRYDEQTSKTEHRPRITYKLIDNKIGYIKPRLEYRHFEGSSDDYFRFRSAFGLKLGNAFIETNPMFRFGAGQDDDLVPNDWQTKIGYNFKLSDNTKLVSFIQHDADKNFNKKGMLLGTTLQINF